MSRGQFCSFSCFHIMITFPKKHSNNGKCDLRETGYLNAINVHIPFVGVNCKLNPCKNDGICVDLPQQNIGAYKGVCKDPFYGRHCGHEFKGALTVILK